MRSLSITTIGTASLLSIYVSCSLQFLQFLQYQAHISLFACLITVLGFSCVGLLSNSKYHPKLQILQKMQNCIGILPISPFKYTVRVFDKEVRLQPEIERAFAHSMLFGNVNTFFGLKFHWDIPVDFLLHLREFLQRA